MLVNGGTELIDDVMVEVVDLVAVTDTVEVQFSSSDPSLQSNSPSQRHLCGTHAPLLH